MILKKNYEKLEFLGDRVLGLVLSKKLIQLFPNEKVGTLDKKLASLVNKNKCYEIGKILKLDEFVLLGNSNKKISKIENKIISDCCESVIGAIYIEKGFEISKKFIIDVWKNYLKHSDKNIVDSIAGELDWGSDKLRDDITCLALDLKNTDLINQKNKSKA